ncbi:L,D-transpeptidase family protein [Desertimonas flava]|uniref:L,D-transpeptidase family protein n=1 Tax=Desertimonas flava TaxID=2064846 RepID=UPI000E34CA4C|nr:L,D-transpeptidase family protein [Desertimonas flava]
MRERARYWSLLAVGSAFAGVVALTACSGGPTGSAAGAGELGGHGPAVAAQRPDVAPLTDAAASTADTAATTLPATTAAATTVAPTTAAPTTAAPATAAPTTAAPTTAAPTTAAPTTLPPSPALIPVAPPDRPFEAVGRNSSDETARIQQRLVDLGFWLSGVDGDYGLTTGQAVMAFQKYVGLEASGRIDEATADALTNIPQRAHGLADAGTLVEIDKDRQVLFFVQNGVTVWVFNVSTGNGESYTEPDQNSPGEVINGVSLTPNGLHAVNRERPEGWWEGDLGQIYRPKYFVGGVAVHGSNNVPNYPASHGCVRVTTTAMDFIWDANLMPMGIPVWVHGAK